MKKCIDQAQLDALEERMRPHAYLTRKHLSVILGGLISPKTLANYDSNRNGIEVKVTMGRTIAYPSFSALKWIRERLVVVE